MIDPQIDPEINHNRQLVKEIKEKYIKEMTDIINKAFDEIEPPVTGKNGSISPEYKLWKQNRKKAVESAVSKILNYK